MDLMKALKVVDTTTRVGRKLQLMVKDAPKVGGIIMNYQLERKFKQLEETQEPVVIKSRNRFKSIK